MDEPKFCVLCGVRPVGDGRVKTCSPECWEVFHGLAHMEWPVVLGHAIARFVRRAEVAGLRNDVLGAAHNWKAARGFELEDQERKARHWGELLAALDALARLAGGGA